MSGRLAVLLLVGAGLLGFWLLRGEEQAAPLKEVVVDGGERSERKASESAASVRQVELSEPVRRAEPEASTSTMSDTVRAALRSTFAAQYPGRGLSAEELDSLTQALLRLRAARAALAATARKASNSTELRRLTDEVAEATTAFERVAGVSLSEFTAKATPDGISHGRDEGEVVFEPLSPPPGDHDAP